MNKPVKILLVLIPVIALAIWLWSERAVESETEVSIPSVVIEDNTAAQGALVRDDASAPAPQSSTPSSTPPVLSEAEQIPVATSPNDSDATVAAALKQLSPALQNWFVANEQVRKWVLAIDLMADGDIPREHRPLTYPIPAFAVQIKAGDWQQGQERYLSGPSNDDRLNPLLEMFVAIPPHKLARYYKTWLPVLNQAYQELGKSGHFSQRVKLAIENVQNVGPRPVSAELHRPKVFYRYTDPQLEQATALQKALWRAGDKNREKLQAYLAEVKLYL